MRFTRCSTGSPRAVHRWVQVLASLEFECSYTLDPPSVSGSASHVLLSVTEATCSLSSPKISCGQVYMAPQNVGRGDICAVDARAVGEDHGWSVRIHPNPIQFKSDDEPVTLSLLAALLFLGGVAFYLPHHIQFLTRRARFYLLGNERESFYAEWPSKVEL